jgi:hypothetical protein
MKTKERARNINSWYTPENVYCLFRLWKMQEKKGIVVAHKDLDKYHKKFLKELGLKPKDGMMMSQKFAHDNGVVLYNLSEDFNMLTHLHIQYEPKDYKNTKKMYLYAVEIQNEFCLHRFECDTYLCFEEIHELIKENEEEEGK